MTTLTPEDRLRTVERHAYDIQAVAESYAAISAFAHMTNNPALGFLIGLLAERLRDETDAILSAAAMRGRGVRP